MVAHQFFGVTAADDAVIVKRAIRNKAKMCHPDNGGTAELFQQFTAAKKELLSKLDEGYNSEDLVATMRAYRQTQKYSNGDETNRVVPEEGRPIGLSDIKTGSDVGDVGDMLNPANGSTSKVVADRTYQRAGRPSLRKATKKVAAKSVKTNPDFGRVAGRLIETFLISAVFGVLMLVALPISSWLYSISPDVYQKFFGVTGYENLLMYDRWFVFVTVVVVGFLVWGKHRNFGVGVAIVVLVVTVGVAVSWILYVAAGIMLAATMLGRHR